MAPFPKLYEAVIIPGGVAGDHAIYGKYLNSDAALVSVHHIDGPLLGTNDDLTSEFGIPDNNVINNDGGTDTTNGWLVVTWIRLR